MLLIKHSLLTATVSAGLLLLPIGASAQQPPAAQNQSAPANANQQSSPQPSTPPDMKAMESMLVSRIHMVNQMEIKAGKMAAQKGSAFDVREYGDRLRMDHSVADGKILSYAKAHGLKVMPPDEIQAKMQQMSGQIPEAEAMPQQMEQQGMSPQSGAPPAQEFQQQMSMAQSKMQQLQGLQGKAFDAAFTQFMEKGHTQAIAMLSMAEHMLPANDGLRSLLSKMVPILEQHYDIASRLQIATVRRQNQALGDQLNAKMTKMKGGQ